MVEEEQDQQGPPRDSRLRYVEPYWHAYSTMAKGRWWGREILELVSTEFRDRSLEYYRYALQSGVTTINNRRASPGDIVRNGDRIQNVVHRHEPPVTSIRVRIIHRDDARGLLVVDKPGSVPVHATGRYYHNSLLQLLKSDFGLDNVYSVNRLDRLTSGCMLLALTPQRARELCDQFVANAVKKEYIARCAGHFPPGETLVSQPLLTIDRQMGLVIVHPDGKPAETLFTRLFYDARTDTSVLHCQPRTGRTHQIRVHLQFLGYPIANDPIYRSTAIWGPRAGRGGIDLRPATAERTPSVIPAEAIRALAKSKPNGIIPADAPGTPALPSDPPTPAEPPEDPPPASTKAAALLPRETGEDIGLSSPVPLSDEAVGVIKRLRDAKDRDEDWARWRDVVFRARAALGPADGRVDSVSGPAAALPLPAPPLALTSADIPQHRRAPFRPALHEPTQTLYCPECYVPLHPDPKPERLYIFLHALRYTTDEGSWEAPAPAWAEESWTGEGEEGWDWVRREGEEKMAEDGVGGKVNEVETGDVAAGLGELNDGKEPDAAADKAGARIADAA